MKIEIWSLGKANNRYIDQGINYYLKRLKPYAQVSFILLPPPKRTAKISPSESIQKEEKIILSKLDSKKHFLILLDETGRMLTSKGWAEAIVHLQNQGTKTIVLLIGGPWGVGERIAQKAQNCWSLSGLTFPHQLVRLIVTEQLYRSFSIINNNRYHHQ